MNKKNISKNGSKYNLPLAGVEPATFGLEVQRAVQLRHKGLYI